MSSYLNNDDDLFDYDPELEKTKISETSFQSSEIPQNDLYNNIKNHLDNDLEHTGNIDNGKVKFSTSYQHALEAFIHETKSEASLKAISIALNALTNNDFNAMILFYETEMRLSRRMLFLEISYRAFNEDENSILSAKNLAKLLNIEFSELYIDTCFKSTWNITEHAIKLDRALYLHLSERLGIPVQQYLFEDIETTANAPHDVYLADYRKDISKEISENMLENGYVECLEKIFNTKIVPVKPNEKDL